MLGHALNESHPSNRALPHSQANQKMTFPNIPLARRVRNLSCVLAFALAANLAAALQKPQTYWRMCDASAAVALDNEHFAVADDEGAALRVYKIGEPDPIHEFELGKFLHGNKKGESDVEGAARVGDRIYWISSHARGRDGDEQPDRQRFFATSIVGKKGLKLEPVGKPCATFLKDLLAEPRFQRFGFAASSALSPKNGGGLNIEGMCARADGSLLIGFRNPVPAGKALLVPLLNPAGLIEGSRAQFGDAIELDLRGFGVRDVSPNGDRFLVLAGSRDGSKIFQLFSWTPNSAPAPIPGNFFKGLNPEAAFRFPNDPPGVFQILSDDGGRKQAGKECKDLPKTERHFRAGEIHLTLPP